MPFWKPYVSVAQRRKMAAQSLKHLLKKGQEAQPVQPEGKAIALSFWGKAWCDHIESFSDFENRIPRGRTYIRNGSVCHLQIGAGRVDAFVSGSMLYSVSLTVKPLAPQRWKAIIREASGRIGSIVELLRGDFSDNVMSLVTHPKNGLFPELSEVTLHCNCPDWAVMCKHVAAVLYGVGCRLDHRPDQLFVLRGVDPQDLIDTKVILPSSTTKIDVIPESALSNLFGITLDLSSPTPKAPDARSSNKFPPSKTSTRPRKSPQARDLSAIEIARLRNHLGLSKTEFARELGVSVASVARWERVSGKVQLKPTSLKALLELKTKVKKKT